LLDPTELTPDQLLDHIADHPDDQRSPHD